MQIKVKETKPCKDNCVLAINGFGKIHECHTNGCVAGRIETNTLYKAEERMFTKAEVISLAKKYREDFIHIMDDEKWFEQNVK